MFNIQLKDDKRSHLGVNSIKWGLTHPAFSSNDGIAPSRSSVSNSLISSNSYLMASDNTLACKSLLLHNSKIHQTIVFSVLMNLLLSITKQFLSALII